MFNWFLGNAPPAAECLGHAQGWAVERESLPIRLSLVIGLQPSILPCAGWLVLDQRATGLACWRWWEGSTVSSDRGTVPWARAVPETTPLSDSPWVAELCFPLGAGVWREEFGILPRRILSGVFLSAALCWECRCHFLRHPCCRLWLRI